MEAIANGLAPREYASLYLKAGWSVLPIKCDGTKSPALNSWTQYQSAPPTPAEARRFWLPDNVGIALVHGEVSGGTEAIDIDFGELFGPYLREVELEMPALIDRLTIIRTPREGYGYHLIYRCPEVGPPQKLAQYPDPENPKKPKTLIEVKGRGGYTLAPGSPGCCHETGGVYEHIDGPPLTAVETITIEEREVLYRVARSFNQWHEETPTTASKPAGERFDGLSPGDDFNRRATWEEILEPHGWINTHGKYWRRPGKTNGWSATVGCVSQHGTELFSCFSDNAHPLQGATGGRVCTVYSKFALYAVLNHGGDYSAAARRLRTEGYGDQPRERVSDGGDRWTNDSSPKSHQQLPPIERIGLRRLIDDHPTLNETVLEGLLRRLEVMNLNAAPKVGKSWFAIYIMLCVATGRQIFGRYPVKQGKVLLVDLELHKSLIASRIQTVAFHMGISPAEYVGMIDVISLRGDWRSTKELLVVAAAIGPDEYVLTVFDSKYRMNPGADENAAGETTSFYNDVDRFAELTNTAVIVVCHQTKGNQADKRITDTGSGSGAQSRAADCHAAIREHEDEGLFVFDAVVRSFAPFTPLVIRWQFPLWEADEWADPSKLKGLKSGGDERQAQRDKEGREAIVKVLAGGAMTMNDLHPKASMGKDRAKKLLAQLESDGIVEHDTTTIAHNAAIVYRLTAESMEVV